MNNILSDKDSLLYYIYDPLCGWCYGFSPVIRQVAEQYKQQFQVEVISGGMVLNDRVGPLREIAPYIRDAYKRVEEMTGVTFGPKYLEDLLGPGDAILNSWPASLAMTVFKSYAPQHSVEYASALQKAIYFDGISSEDLSYFGQLAVQFGIDPAAFMLKTQDESYHYATKQDFQLASDMQVTGFPAVILFHKEEYFLLAKGYTDLKTLTERIDRVLTS
jgi:putative protein-disulfide isomerase